VILVRSFTREDVPAVVRLRRAVFRTTERPNNVALADYYTRVFFKSPWYDPAMPSLVAENGCGIVGFIGVIPRPFTYRGETIRAAITTEFMVHPAHRGRTGLQLFQAFLRSGQDISFADRANDDSRALFEALGGGVAMGFSFYWTYPARPWPHALAQVGAGSVLRPVAAGARRVAAVLDQLLPRAAAPTGPARVEPLAVDAVADAWPRMLTACDLYPGYDRASLAWLLERLAEKTRYGALDAFQLREEDDLAGWCVMLVRAGGRAEIVHWGAARDRHRAVFDCAVARAAERGAITMAGRFDPAFGPTLAELRVPFTLAQPWTLVHARRPELLHALARGRAFFSRLDGDWWLST
jgi:hypothetical protein